jgi:hypothetical protein
MKQHKVDKAVKKLLEALWEGGRWEEAEPGVLRGGFAKLRDANEFLAQVWGLGDKELREQIETAWRYEADLCHDEEDEVSLAIIIRLPVADKGRIEKLIAEMIRGG